uniref:MOB kinase activator 2-like isoform X1 n=1 Tax=Myxine glutinosa TaxID=7769 RepID=UPI00358F9A40
MLERSGAERTRNRLYIMVLQAVGRVLRWKSKKDRERPADQKKTYLDGDVIRAQVTDCDFGALVRLPDAIDHNEWLATHTTTFFNHISLQYSTISEYCTSQTCPSMAIPGTMLHWQDGEKGKKVKLAAPQYVDCVMCSVQRLVTNESIFPTKFGQEFPPAFSTYIQRIFRLCFHVLAHLYHSHFRETVALDLHSHLNSLYVHFVTFALQFSLLPPAELAPLSDLTDALCIPSASSPHHRAPQT